MATRKKPKPEIDPTAVLGASGLQRQGDDVFDEFHRKLRGRDGAKIYREMRDNDATIGAIFYVLQGLIRQVSWTVEPADESTEAEREAEFLEECLDDMSHTWADFLGEVLSMLVYGWAMFEKVYKRRVGPEQRDPAKRSKHTDGRLGWRKIALRGQESLDGWRFDDDGGIRGMWQTAAPDYQRVFLPIEKCVLFRTGLNKNNPEGRSALRNAYRPWFLLKRVQEIEAIGIERDLVGLPKLELPEEYFDANASTAKKNALRNFYTQVRQIRRNEHEGLVMPAEVDREGNPTGYKMSLMSTGGARQFDTVQIKRNYQQDIAMTVAMQFLFLGMDKAGSFALSSDMTDLSALAIGAILDGIEETFDRFCTQELYDLNGVKPEARACLKHGDLEKEDVVRFADTLQRLMNAGAITPDAALEDHIRQKLELPEADDEEPVPFAPPVAAPPPTQALAAGDEVPQPEDEGLEAAQ